LECIIAPGYEPEALEILTSKKNRRILTLEDFKAREDEVRYRQIDGGWLAQVQGPPSVDWDNLECPTVIKADKKLVKLA